jgi:hypothetical protein
MKVTDPGSTTKRRPSPPPGYTSACPPPGSVSGYLLPNVASFVCSALTKGLRQEGERSLQESALERVTVRRMMWKEQYVRHFDQTRISSCSQANLR